MEQIEQSFDDIGITSELIQKLNELNITKPTTVQQKVIPEILDNKSLLFQSETGTGKTFAFLLPILQNINKDELSTEVLIISPTHELSSQTKSEISKLSDVKSALCIGGTLLKRQVEVLKTKPKIVLGSPVRIIELIKLRKLKRDNIRFIVFDEIDRLIAPELRDETIELLSLMNNEIQVIGCSATIKKSIAKIFETELIKKRENYNLELIELPMEDILQKRIQHWAIFSEQRDKIDTLRSLIKVLNPTKALIFTSKNDQVLNISQKLLYKKIECESINSKTDKQQRKSIIDRFKSGKTNLLITSDLAARGLDIQSISHVIQMDFPSNSDFFIHRAGRTGRAGLNGINIVIGDRYEMQKYSVFEKKIGIKVFPKELHSGKLLDPNDF